MELIRNRLITKYISLSRLFGSNIKKMNTLTIFAAEVDGSYYALLKQSPKKKERKFE